MIKHNEKKTNNTIPIFFASDDNYVPFLAVAIDSLLDNSSINNSYKIYIMTKGISKNNEKRLLDLKRDNSEIIFVDVTEKMGDINNKIHLRDYYTDATYYRIFIADMFPQYDKAIYLDCDITVVGDISEFYNRELNHNVLGAVQEEVMKEVPIFGEYVEKALGIKCEKYFSAGILLLNLKEFRKRNIETKFIELMSKYKFAVTQDQDYLNVVCKGLVSYFHLGWNKAPINKDFDDKKLKIIHYKLNWKPWHYSNIAYEEHFWKYAESCGFFNEIISILNNYDESCKLKDTIAYERLVQLAINDINDVNNYYNQQIKIPFEIEEEKNWNNLVTELTY